MPKPMLAIHVIHTNAGGNLKVTTGFDREGNPRLIASTKEIQPGEIFEWEGEESDLQWLVDEGATVEASGIELAKYLRDRDAKATPATEHAELFE